MIRSKLNHSCEICGAISPIILENDLIKCSSCEFVITTANSNSGVDLWNSLNPEGDLQPMDNSEGLDIEEQRQLLRIAKVQQSVIERTWKILHKAGLAHDLKDIATGISDLNLSLEAYEMKINE